MRPTTCCRLYNRLSQPGFVPGVGTVFAGRPRRAEIQRLSAGPGGHHTPGSWQPGFRVARPDDGSLRNRRNAVAFERAADQFMALGGDLDKFLGTRTEFMLGKWIGDAKSWAANKERAGLLRKGCAQYHHHLGRRPDRLRGPAVERVDERLLSAALANVHRCHACGIEGWNAGGSTGAGKAVARA